MSDKVFLDTNILVYAYSDTEPYKRDIARNAVLNNRTNISTQVLQELTNVVIKKFSQNYQAASALIIECTQNSNLHINTQTTILSAHRIAERYRLSFYDSMIVSAALESNCNLLYSEDMHNGLLIDDRLTITNPFYDDQGL